MNKVHIAEKFAKEKHRGQKRNNGKTPYWKHLQQVVDNLKKLGIKNPDILCAGWLHDTIEDTNTDYDDLEEKFGKKVADIVSQVTKDKRLPRKKRELQYIRQLRKASFDAKLAKLCDITANIMDLENFGDDYQKKVKQVNNKLQYLSAIKSGICPNKSKLSGFTAIMNDLNEQLEKYDKNSI